MTDISAIAAASNLTPREASTPCPADKMFAKFHGKNHAVGVRTVAFDLDDVVDMMNPLQHVPVLSSLYRAVTDEEISPVSRIAGDTLYGGVLGLGSACMSMASAAADEIMAASTGGTASEILVSALTDNGETQVAAAEKAAVAETKVAALQTPAPQAQAPAPAETNTTAINNAKTSDTTATAHVASAPTAGSDKSFALDRSKQPYGGVMDTSLMANAQQNQALALAMAGQNQVLQAQRTLRNGRFASAAPAAAAAVESAANHVTTMEPQTQAAMQGLLEELRKMKAMDAYRNAAMSMPVSGGNLNIVN